MSTFTIIFGILIVAAIAIYFFGIPAEWKREMERKALETMGENKASYMVKGNPSSDDLLQYSNGF
jgi:hypothetical protein